jgi:NAD(P)-dependent dehydrogenase (short-subunit alcohol dehydrogenase family)
MIAGKELTVFVAGLWGLVNNAGIGGIPCPSEWLAKEDWDKVLSINLMGVIYVTKAFLPLVRQEKGRVVNVASILGRIASMSTGPYCVSKYGVEAFSDSLR